MLQNPAVRVRRPDGPCLPTNHRAMVFRTLDVTPIALRDAVTRVAATVVAVDLDGQVCVAVAVDMHRQCYGQAQADKSLPWMASRGRGRPEVHSRGSAQYSGVTWPTVAITSGCCRCSLPLPLASWIKTAPGGIGRGGSGTHPGGQLAEAQVLQLPDADGCGEKSHIISHQVRATLGDHGMDGSESAIAWRRSAFSPRRAATCRSIDPIGRRR